MNYPVLRRRPRCQFRYRLQVGQLVFIKPILFSDSGRLISPYGFVVRSYLNRPKSPPGFTYLVKFAESSIYAGQCLWVHSFNLKAAPRPRFFPRLKRDIF